MSVACIHYVGFRDDRYWNAFRVFGGPRFIHRWWDRRAAREIAPGDTIVFADGDWTQTPRDFNAPDIDESDLPISDNPTGSINPGPPATVMVS